MVVVIPYLHWVGGENGLLLVAGRVLLRQICEPLLIYFGHKIVILCWFVFLQQTFFEKTMTKSFRVCGGHWSFFVFLTFLNFRNFTDSLICIERHDAQERESFLVCRFRTTPRALPTNRSAWDSARNLRSQDSFYSLSMSFTSALSFYKALIEFSILSLNFINFFGVTRFTALLLFFNSLNGIRVLLLIWIIWTHATSGFFLLWLWPRGHIFRIVLVFFCDLDNSALGCVRHRCY